MNINKLVTLALFTAMSLALFVVELQLPTIIPAVPGVKLGLANIVTLFILHRKDFTAVDALLVVVARVCLAGFLTGNLFSLLYSFSGWIAALLVMIAFRKLFKSKLIPVTAVAGALAHNTMQICVAVFIAGAGMLLYLPVLVLSGILSGLLTGFATNLIIRNVKI